MCNFMLKIPIDNLQPFLSKKPLNLQPYKLATAIGFYFQEEIPDKGNGLCLPRCGREKDGEASFTFESSLQMRPKEAHYLLMHFSNMEGIGRTS